MSVNNVNGISKETLTQIKNKAGEISNTSESSIWNEYKQFDINGNGNISDDLETMSESDVIRMGQMLGIVSDGQISDTKQSEKTGDCYLLSGVNALSNTSWGKEAVKNAISEDGEGGYNVQFYNANGELETVHVTSEELSANPEKYSSGDTDMNIIEVAAEKFYAAHADEEIYSYKNSKNPLETGLMEGKTSILYMLTGLEGTVLQTGKADTKIPKFALSSDRSELNAASFEKFFNSYAENPDDIAATCSFKKENFFKKLFNSNKFEQTSGHGYSIKGITRNADGSIASISFQNPWDSSQAFTLTYEEALSRINYLTGYKNPS